MSKEKQIVGVQEWCGFPSLHIPAIKARVDSGAKTSSLHAFNIKPHTKKGKHLVTFDVHPVQGSKKIVIACEAEVHDRRKVKSSTGHAEYRYVIMTELRLGKKKWKVELNLTNRDTMGYRMLLGRQATQGRYLIDPAEAFLQGEKDDAEVKRKYLAELKS